MSGPPSLTVNIWTILRHARSIPAVPRYHPRASFSTSHLPLATQLPRARAPIKPPPPAPKPTELPYDTIRKDPEFRRLSRRYTALMVGIPFLIVTSWALYKRYEGTLVQRKGMVERDVQKLSSGKLSVGLGTKP